MSVAPLLRVNNYRLLFPAAFTFFHRAFAKADNLALPAALIFRFGFAASGSELAGVGVRPCFAILLATPARMLAMAWGLRFLLFLPRFAWGASGTAGAETSPPSSSLNCCCSASIRSLRSAAFLSCCGVKLLIDIRRNVDGIDGMSRIAKLVNAVAPVVEI